MSHCSPRSNEHLVRVIILSNSQPRIVVYPPHRFGHLLSVEPPGVLQLIHTRIGARHSSSSHSATPCTEEIYLEKIVDCRRVPIIRLPAGNGQCCELLYSIDSTSSPTSSATSLLTQSCTEAIREEDRPLFLLLASLRRRENQQCRRTCPWDIWAV